MARKRVGRLKERRCGKVEGARTDAPKKGEGQKGIRLRGITTRSNVVNINETKVISVFLFFK